MSPATRIEGDTLLVSEVVDDLPAVVSSRDGGCVGGDAEVVRPVVFNEERPVLSHDPEHRIPEIG